jgi:hypothetical protein
MGVASSRTIALGVCPVIGRSTDQLANPRLS